MKNLLTYLIISLSILQNLAGQATYNFKHISSQNGLSNDFVLDMAIDQQGCVWVATEAGLNKWVGNGSNIVYKESNSGLVSNELTSLYYDPSENILWVGSRQEGISLFDCRTQQFKDFTTDEGLSSNSVTDIMPAAGDKGVWIAYLSGEIDFYDKQTKKIISYNSRNIPGLTGRNRCCRDDKNGALYVGHIGNGMTIINLKEKTAKKYLHEPDDPQSIPGDNGFVQSDDRDIHLFPTRQQK